MTDSTKKTKASIGGPVLYKNFIKNWTHQALTYMDRGERLLRVFVEFIELILSMFMIHLLFKVSFLFAFIIAFIMVHTFNWMTNGLFWAVLIFAVPYLNNPGEKKTLQYLNIMTKRLRIQKSISGIALFGSIARNKWHDRSDIDIRILRKPGIKNLIVSYCLTMRERFIAFIHKQPMDLYLADDISFLKKMRSDEKPVFLMKRDPRLDEMYPGNREKVLQKLRD
jgi:predicted nucleotidyltransferase